MRFCQQKSFQNIFSTSKDWNNPVNVKKQWNYIKALPVNNATPLRSSFSWIYVTCVQVIHDVVGKNFFGFCLKTQVCKYIQHFFHTSIWSNTKDTIPNDFKKTTKPQFVPKDEFIFFPWNEIFWVWKRNGPALLRPLSGTRYCKFKNSEVWYNSQIDFLWLKVFILVTPN